VIIVTLLVLTFAAVGQLWAASPMMQPRPQKGKKPIVTLTTKPSWLLMTSDDAAKRCGDTVRIGGPLSLPGSDFDFRGFDRAEPLTIQLCPEGRVAWVKGKGEITKISAGELVALPLAEKQILPPPISAQTKATASAEQIYQWQIDAASKIDCWWHCTSPTGCSTGSLDVSPGTVVARRDDPEGKWVPPNSEQWTKVCGTLCRIVTINLMGFSFGGDCTLSNPVKK
jgi:hypothetical protein